MSRIESVTFAVTNRTDAEGKEFSSVRFTPTTLELHTTEESPRTRFSILFPVIPEKFVLPKSEDFFVDFVAHRSPLGAVQRLNGSMRASLLFGYGLASLVSVSAQPEPLDQLREKLRSGLIAVERWIVRQGMLDSWEIPVHPELPDLKWMAVDQASTTDSSVKWVISELNMNLKRYAQLCSMYAPEALSDFEELMAEVHDTADDLSTMERLSRNDKVNGTFLPIERKRRWDISVDWLVQANSSLVYSITQGFHGALPNRFKRGLISQNSLIGTGTAWRAIFRIYVQIKSAFRRACLSLFIESAFPKLPKIDWAQIDKYTFTEALSLLPPQGEDPRNLGMSSKIVNFSSRLGFGETDASLTCPAQILQTCDSPQWSLVTISHEMLHTHVRDLLAAIFTHYENDEPIEFNESVSRCIEDYLQKNNGEDASNLLDSVRFAIIDYAFVYRNSLEDFHRYYPNRDNPEDEHSVDVSVPNREKTLNAFLRANRFTEEVMIHVLDLYYFYRGDSALFVDSLWNTWATVPSTVNKLDWYVLRTLLALASLTQGRRYDRLEMASRVLIDRLKAMEERGRGIEIVGEVLDRLDNQERFRLWLDILFPPSLKIVDLTKQILYHKDIATQLLDSADPLVQLEGYQLETESFDENGVKSPVAFIFDRLRRSVEASEQLDAIQLARRSCWVLLAASSDPDKL